MPPLRDLTGGRAPVPVEVRAGRLFELLAAAWVISDKGLISNHEAGAELWDTIVDRFDAAQRARLERINVAGGAVWLSLFELAGRLEHADRVGDLVGAMDSQGPLWLRTQLLSLGLHECDGHVEAAASGDAAALQALEQRAQEHPKKLQRFRETAGLLETDDPTLLADIGSSLIDLDEALAEHLDRVEPALRRDASASRALALTTPPERVIEQVTRGIEYRLRPGIDSIRIVPSAVVRPWALMLEDGSTQVFVYPIAEEHLDPDSDTPPAWLVATYKALADERRLRILRRLATAPATLGDLVDHVGLAKSTVHHHIGVLRSAGLVRVSIGDHKEHSAYSLRPEVLPEAERLLAMYLTSENEGDR